MGEVPTEVAQVAKWDKDEERQQNFPDAEVWMVDSVNEEHQYAKAEDLTVLPSTSSGFGKGRPVLKAAIPISTAGGAEPPRVVLRTVYDGQAHGEIKARGYGRCKTDPLYFQRMLQKHLTWICKERGPFISVTSRYEKAIRMAACFYARGFTGIKILVILTDGPSWNHKDQRIWHVESLVSELELRGHVYYENEYLIENEIPSGPIIGAFHWDSLFRRLRNFTVCEKNDYEANLAYARTEHAKTKRRQNNLRRKAKKQLLEGIPGLQDRKRARNFTRTLNMRRK
ncbi:hypothetical protein B0H63DRAFT_518636 [Podospora didyma]|uniref:DUF7587 domain-containing protein n=1 Tax=Podospora didyma TaxID=330526 RepID=A0AAE0U3F3_9PEZI|nr:hypothetical protein B0H63DRAFT_518636 [Podospora didyma]